MKTVTYFSH